MTGRAERLQWCKDRALAHLPGDPAAAMASFISDAGKSYGDQPHLIDWTQSAMGFLQQMGMLAAMNRDAGEMRRWIEGFN